MDKMSLQQHFFEYCNPGDKFYWYEHRTGISVNNPYSIWKYSGICDEVESEDRTCVAFRSNGICSRVGLRRGVWVAEKVHSSWLKESDKADRFILVYERSVSLLGSVSFHTIMNDRIDRRILEFKEKLKRELNEVDWFILNIAKHGSIKNYIDGVENNDGDKVDREE